MTWMIQIFFISGYYLDGNPTTDQIPGRKDSRPSEETMLGFITLILGVHLLTEEIWNTWDVWNPIDSGKNYQPQLVQDFFHKQ